jgi:hypothetical protein
MLPEHPEPLTGKAAKRFIEQDKKPLTEKQKDYLKECIKIYEDNPVK